MTNTINLEEMAVALKPNGAAVAVPDALKIQGQVLPAVASLTQEQLDAIQAEEQAAAAFLDNPQRVAKAAQGIAYYEAAKDKAGELMAELARLKAENGKLKAKAGQSVVGRLTLRVAEKGGLSVYGLGRWPVTLYREQWEALLRMTPEIRQFIEDNSAVLKFKE